jgi:hypothetical protein
VESLPEISDWCMASGKISIPSISVCFYVTYIKRNFNSIDIYGNYDTSDSLVPAGATMTDGSSTGCAYNIAY